jgi:hypothetical protein
VSGLVTQNRASPLKQRKDDLYSTPPGATRALLEAEQLPRLIWEPAAGLGAIVDVLRAAGHEVIASDLINYGVPGQVARRDFLLERQAPAGCEAVCTNPPFKLCTEFVEHALDLVPRVYMFLRLAFLESRRRSAILDGGHLARVHVFANRVQGMHRHDWPGPKTTSAIPFAWFVWDRNHEGPALLDRIEVRK